MIPYGTPEWTAARLGKVTASRLADVIARTKTGWGASRKHYSAQLVCERLTGRAQESYQNAAMAWGIAHEPEARAAYAFLADAEVTSGGFVDHPRIAMAGASPDGLVGVDGLVEFKCPLTATHLDTLLHEHVPDDYFVQMQWQMAVTGRQWCDYVSYDPRVPEHMRVWISRIPRWDLRIDLYEHHVVEFLGEVEADVKALEEKYRKAA